MWRCEATRIQWPHAFQLQSLYLSVSSCVHNVGRRTADVHAADIGCVRVTLKSKSGLALNGRK